MADGFVMKSLRKGKVSLNPKTTGKISQEPYSYEHRISLDQDTLDKLGIDVPKVGDKYHVLGHGEVTHVSQHSQPGEKTTRVELQLKRMGIKKAPGGGLLGAVSKGVDDASNGD